MLPNNEKIRTTNIALRKFSGASIGALFVATHKDLRKPIHNYSWPLIHMFTRW